jgi:hypothetical protein
MGLSATGAWRMWPLSVTDKAYAQLGHFTSKITTEDSEWTVPNIRLFRGSKNMKGTSIAQ